MGLDLRNKFDFAGNKIAGTATKNTTTNIDFKMPADSWLDGGMILVKDHVKGDYFIIEIVDIDNILGGGAGAILKTYVNWYVHPDLPCLQVETNYAGKVLKNLYLRVKYTSVGTVNNVWVAANYRLNVVEA